MTPQPLMLLGSDLRLFLKIPINMQDVSLQNEKGETQVQSNLLH